MRFQLLSLRILSYAAMTLAIAVLIAGCGGSASNQSLTPTTTISAVSAACSPVGISGGGTAQCTATVQGSGNYSSAVSWSASAGTISPSGLLTVPATPGNVTVTATSTQQPSASGSTVVSVTASATVSSVSVTCQPSSVTAGGTTQCTAAVQGTGTFSTAVSWSASAGSITSSGLLTAPTTSGNVTVSAASTQQSSIVGSTVVPVSTSATVASVAASCQPSTVSTGGTAQCTAAVQGSGSYSSAVTWSTSAGTISSTGVLTAPASDGDVTVTATSAQSPAESGEATVAVQLAVRSSQHIVMVMEENQDYSTVVGASAWPNLNKLISNGALATKYYANTHPSIGNYLMLTTGQVLTNNDNSTTVWDVDNIARRMLAANVSFRIYAEGIKQGYVGGNSGDYLVRHNPFALLSDIADHPSVADKVIAPFSQFAVDLANGTLPELSFIVPNVVDDAHNGTPHQADSWLQANLVTPLSKTAAFQAGGDGVLIVDFDEAADSDTSHGGGHVPAVLWGPIVKTGYKEESDTVYQHQSMLCTIMEALGLQNPPAAAEGAPSMSEFFVQK